MNVKIAKSLVERALSTLAKIQEHYNSMPVFDQVLIRAGENELQLACASPSRAMRAVYPAEVGEPGETTVDMKTLRAILATFENNLLDIYLREQSLELTCGRSHARLPFADPNEFPSIEFPSAPDAIVLSSEMFREAVSRTVFAASRDDAWPVFKGALFESTGASLRLTTTNGFCLARLEIAAASSPFSAIIPADDLCIVAEAAHEEVRMDIRGNEALFFMGEFALKSSLISGRFPDISSILPKSFQTHARVLTSELKNAMRGADIFRDEELSPEKISIAENSVIIRIEGGAGAITYEIDATVEGCTLDFCINARNVLEMINANRAPEIEIGANVANAPLSFVPAGAENYCYLVMPMRL